MDEAALFLFFTVACVISICYTVYGVGETATGYKICKGRKISGNTTGSFVEANELGCARQCLEATACNAAHFMMAGSTSMCFLFTTQVSSGECQSLHHDMSVTALIMFGSPACSGKGLQSQNGRCICNRRHSGNQCEQVETEKIKQAEKICATGYECSEGINGSYRILGPGRDWYNANITCAAEGGHILRIESIDELNAYISAVFQPEYARSYLVAGRFIGGGSRSTQKEPPISDPHASGTGVWFLDGIAEGNPGVWLTGDHNPVPWLHWGNGEPTGDTPPCLGLNRFYGWKFIDCRCTQNFSVICEID